MSSKENVEHEQIPPQEMERIKNEFRSKIKSAFVMLTSPKENVRRLGAITLRRLHMTNEGLNYLVSETEIQVLITQIESEKNLGAQVAEVSALSEVSHYLETNSLKPLVSDLLKKLNADKYNREIVLEAQYQNHLLKNSDEPKDYIVFEKMGLKKSDFVTTDAMFGHTVWDFTKLNYDELTAKSAVVTAALKKILTLKTNAIVLKEALEVTSFMENSASSVFPEVAKLASHEFWRIRKLSLKILHSAGELKLVDLEVKKKLLADPIAEVEEIMVAAK